MINNFNYSFANNLTCLALLPFLFRNTLPLDESYSLLCHLLYQIESSAEENDDYIDCHHCKYMISNLNSTLLYSHGY